MSNPNTSTFWMSLAHPQGRLILTQTTEDPLLRVEPPSYQAWFHGVTRLELLDITARSLAAEKRFNHQLRRPVSVLEHSDWLDRFLRQENKELADYAALHDTPEFAGHDISACWKTDDTSERENAVYEAFEWKVPHPEGEAMEEFKKWDKISAAAEATLFGYPWPWIQTYRDRFGDEPLDRYIMHIARHERRPLDEVLMMWQLSVSNRMSKKGIRLDEKFIAPPEVLSQIVHR